MSALRLGARGLVAALALALVMAAAAAPAAAGTISGGFSPPVEGVRVVVLDSDEKVVKQARTDSEGRFSFRGIGPGSYRVEVRDWPQDKGTAPPPQTFRVRDDSRTRSETRMWTIAWFESLGDDAWSQLNSIWTDHRLVVYGAFALLAAALAARSLLRRRARGPRISRSSRQPGRVGYPELEEVKGEGVEGLDRHLELLRPLKSAHPRQVVQLYLAYRDEQAWSRMSSLLREMPTWLKRLTVVRQQIAFALNRDGKDREAEKKLLKLLRGGGDGRTAETYGLLARVYKDRWERAVDAGDTSGAAKLLDKAIDAYIAGFNADPKNAWPGLNALTLMEFYDERPEIRTSLLREVTVAANATYWGHAGRLELAILTDEETAAREALAAALDSPHNRWEVATTFRNLRLIRTARMQLGRPFVDWQREVVAAIEEEATGE